jgi:hypothetical protein
MPSIPNQPSDLVIQSSSKSNMSSPYLDITSEHAGYVMKIFLGCISIASITYFSLSRNSVNNRARHFCFLALTVINFTFELYSFFENPWSIVLVLSRLCLVRLFVDIRITRSREEWKRALIDHTPSFELYDFLVRTLDEIEVDT